MPFFRSSIRTTSSTLYLATLLFAPLAFGSVETWSIGTVEVLIFLSGGLFFFQVNHDQPLLEVPGIVPLLFLLLLIAIQLCPLPPALVRVIAPAIHQVYDPILAVEDSGRWIPLTVNQKATFLEFLRFSSYVLFYVLTVQFLSRRRLLLRTVKIIATLASAIAFLAILQQFTSPDKIFWFRTTPNGHPAGPWVYTNHYAGFMELVFPLVLALFFFYRPNIGRKRPLRETLVSLFSSPGSNRSFLLGFCAILIPASVFITRSRGGIIAITLGLFFFLFLLSRKEKNRGKLLLFLLPGIIVLASSWFGWDMILGKFLNSSGTSGLLANDRIRIWLETLPLLADFPISGSGFGTFPFIFQQYSTMSGSSEFIEHAHNDYIEFFANGGLITIVLGIWFLITLIRLSRKRLADRREPYSILLIIAALTAIFTILVHSVTDFNMQNGANGLYFFFLCGLLVSAGNTRLVTVHQGYCIYGKSKVCNGPRRHSRSGHSLLRPVTTNTWKGALGLSILLLFFTALYQIGIIRGERIYSHATHIYLNPQLSKKIMESQLTAMDKAGRADPLESLYPYRKGHLFHYLQQEQASLGSYLEAARKNPMNADYLQRIAFVLPSEDLSKATALLEAAYRRGIDKKRFIFPWAEWHLRHERRREALDVLGRGLASFPRLGTELPGFLRTSQLNQEEIGLILPPNVAIWIRIGVFAEKQQRAGDAAFYFGHALDPKNLDGAVTPRNFHQVYAFYHRQKLADKAAAVLHLGIKFFPDSPLFHTLLGDYYRQKDRPERAREEYQRALQLDSGNGKIKRKIERLP